MKIRDFLHVSRQCMNVRLIIGGVRFFSVITAGVMAVLVISCQKPGDGQGGAATKKERQVPGTFNVKMYRDTVDEVFFSDSARTGLQRLRNEVFARHGIKFRNKDLQRHFEQKDWYSVNPWYRDGMLSADEVAFVDDVVKAEILLAEMPDSLKEFYKSEVAFRKRTDVDTTVVSKRDYTGDGKKETQYTRIFKDGGRIHVVTTITGGRDTLYNNRVSADFAPEHFEYRELMTDYNAVLRGIASGKERKTDESWPEYVYSLMTEDIARLTGKTIHGIDDAVLKSYVHTFKGVLLHTATSEDGGCGYIWYTPLRKFVTFYCP